MLWDLDNEARETAESLGLQFARAATAGTHPAFVTAIRELVEEQLDRRDAEVDRDARAVRHRLPGRVLPGTRTASEMNNHGVISRSVRLRQR